ncbi:ACP S-malonyltransferase [Luteimicrobium xylanilyticum]|uniref:[acyl-carrier-protein] S-malonyltransferase n=1 Tax=Luteimicrobium xylanilyticum TaxID=1133546 RepID=A0A5P9QBM1_9MICO|nr:ACP S-malonyltransferase [Luteimicrobium xylanilyticum]QFU98636.1 [Acyl-carrier-protein] S-malonyltransferase [Luteimicrobium xylanilyticum]
MLAVVCPGQGSQTPGMLAPWLDLPGLNELLGSWSELAGVDLVAHGTTSDADTIRDTAVAQPLIVGASLLSAHAILGDDLGVVDVTAGHSVGEFAAAALAGVLSPEQAIRLVGVRGAAMARAAAAEPTGMSAVLGGQADDVTARLDELGLVGANVNGGGQVVAAGALEALAALAAEPPTRARVIPLQVAGAFHTETMRPAVAELQAAVDALPAPDGDGAPRVALLSNADGAVVDGRDDALARLVRQVANPVRWDLCQATLAERGVTGLLELAPGGVLTGLARRTLPGVEAFAVKSADDADAARAFVARHAGAGTSSDG